MVPRRPRFCVLGVVVTFLLGLGLGESPTRLALEGERLWSTRTTHDADGDGDPGRLCGGDGAVVSRLIEKLAAIPKTPKSGGPYCLLFHAELASFVGL